MRIVRFGPLFEIFNKDSNEVIGFEVALQTSDLRFDHRLILAGRILARRILSRRILSGSILVGCVLPGRVLTALSVSIFKQEHSKTQEKADSYSSGPRGSHN